MQVARIFLATGIVFLVFVLIWMNRYHYDGHIPYHVTRINRFSGQICYSQPDGTWNSQLNPLGKGDPASQSLGDTLKKQETLSPSGYLATPDRQNLCR